MNFLAIDPGVSGGIAYLDTDGTTHAMPMPATLGDIRDQLRILAKVPATCFLEELPKFAGRMGASSMGVMFRNYGRIEGFLAAAGCRVEYLRPQKWQQFHSLGSKKDHGTKWKNHLKGKAQSLFPHLTVTLKTADALLILEAGMKLSRS
ncbi:MAG: Flavobacterium phage vB FspS tant8 [Verrucomicrobiota bacterium]|jgi:hypothetical protein